MPQRFSFIEVNTVLRGKPHSYSYAKPAGYSLAEYREIGIQAIRAFPNVGTQIIGTPL